jgi:hypothetical protein
MALLEQFLVGLITFKRQHKVSLSNQALPRLLFLALAY